MRIMCQRLVLIGLLMFSVSIVLAAPKQKDKQPRGGDRHERNGGTRVAVDIFIDNDRDIIRHHYHPYRGSRDLPPGLAKGDLPPGLEKQLRRNGRLPPGLEKKIAPFPVVIERSLPPLRPGLIRGLIGGMAVIMDRETSVLVDVFAVF